jgi:DcuC family C4-dicarboxylate transporter
MTTLLGGLVVAAVVVAVRRGWDVRLVLLAAGLLLGTLAAQPEVVVRRFFSTLVAEEFVVPICCAMGFAQALRHTGCDRHLVRLLLDPVRRARRVLIPAAVVAGFVVNVPIISQTSAAAAMGAVLVPLMLASGVGAATAGATLLLGTSLGGELLNPGAPEFRTVVRDSGALGLTITGADCVRAVLPLALLHLLVSTAAFWLLSRRAERGPAVPPPPAVSDGDGPVSLLKAAVPLVPLALLFAVGPPLELFRVPQEWLVAPRDVPGLPGPFESRLIGAAMVLGTLGAALSDRRAGREIAGQFFLGAGYAYTHIISIIVAAACFGEGVKLMGLARLIGVLVEWLPHLLLPIASLFALALAALSGSGMAATQSLFGLFAEPALLVGVAPELLGAVVALSAAAGRTMSPVAAVALMCASLTGTQAGDLARRVAVPLLVGTLAVVAAATAVAAAGGQSARQDSGISAPGPPGGPPRAPEVP